LSLETLISLPATEEYFRRRAAFHALLRFSVALLRRRVLTACPLVLERRLIPHQRLRTGIVSAQTGKLEGAG
jgi:hypothetical protein